MPEQLTLEKLKISERLTVLETKFESLETKIESNIEKLNYIIIGNGTPGLSEKVRELQHKEERREMINKLSIGAVITLGAKAIWDSIMR